MAAFDGRPYSRLNEINSGQKHVFQAIRPLHVRSDRRHIHCRHDHFLCNTSISPRMGICAGVRVRRHSDRSIWSFARQCPPFGTLGSMNMLNQYESSPGSAGGGSRSPHPIVSDYFSVSTAATWLQVSEWTKKQFTRVEGVTSHTLPNLIRKLHLSSTRLTDE